MWLVAGLLISSAGCAADARSVDLAVANFTQEPHVLHLTVTLQQASGENRSLYDETINVPPTLDENNVSIVHPGSVDVAEGTIWVAADVASGADRARAFPWSAATGADFFQVVIELDGTLEIRQGGYD